MDKEPKISKSIEYKWFKDKKILGMILLLTIVILMIFSWFKAPVISTITSYTVVMLFGFYNPLFYLFFLYLSFVLLFGDRLKIPSWVKINAWNYWLIFFLIIFIGVSTGYYQTETSFVDFGDKNFSNTFKVWYNNFTDNESTEAIIKWAPNNTNGGVVGAFLYSVFSSFSSGVGSLMFSIIFFILVVSYIATGTSIGLYKELHRKRKNYLKTIEDLSENDNLLLLSNAPKSDKPNEKAVNKAKKEKKEVIENPFDAFNSSDKPQQIKETPIDKKPKKLETDDFENPF